MRVFYARFVALFRKVRLEEELNDELRFHMEMQVEQNLRRGMAPEEALLEARRSFGNLARTKESYREQRGWPAFEALLQDARYALRLMGKRPGFTTVAVLTLALAIGASTAVFSVVNAVLLRPLPYRDPDRLVVVMDTNLRLGNWNPTSPGNYLEWKELNRVFEDLGAAEYWTPTLTGGDAPERTRALHVTPDIFKILGVNPLLGRTLGAEDGERERHRVVVISHGLWQRRFGGSPEIIGRSLRVDGENYDVVGVMPLEFYFAPFWATQAEMWAPMSFPPGRARERGGNSLRLFARLKPGVSFAQADAEMKGLARLVRERVPQIEPEWSARTGPLREVVVGNIRPTLLVLFGAVAFLVLLACANVANLLLHRATARTGEMALRQALGAGRGRLLRQLLVESLVLGLAGAVVGAGLAWWGVQSAMAAIPADALPRGREVGMDLQAFAFSLAVSVLSAVMFGIAPAWRCSKPQLVESLKSAGRGAALTGRRVYDMLVVLEVAVAVVLLAGAGLMVRSFVNLQAVDPGFKRQNVLTMIVPTAGTRFAAPEQRSVFYQQLVERTGALPGVQSASAINHLPLVGDTWGLTVTLEDKPMLSSSDQPSAIYRVVLPGYFPTMGAPLRAGREFNSGDRVGSPSVVVINETMARRYWPGESPIGKRLKAGLREQSQPWATVVGVVKDVRQAQWAAEPDNEVYWPFLQDQRYLSNPRNLSMTLVVRTAGDPNAMVPSIRREIGLMDPNLPISDVVSMEQAIADVTWRPRFTTELLGAFAAIALVLAVIGVYAVMSYRVGRRRQEMGIRIALGARPSRLVATVMGEGFLLVAAGLAAGFAAALGLTRLMSTLLFQVTPTDPLTFTLIPCILAAAALAANYIPARRAARLDPTTALRQE